MGGSLSENLPVVTITINENIKYWREFSPFELSWENDASSACDSKRALERLGFNKECIDSDQGSLV